MGDGRELDLNGRRKGLRSALALDVEGWSSGGCATPESYRVKDQKKINKKKIKKKKNILETKKKKKKTESRTKG